MQFQHADVGGLGTETEAGEVLAATDPLTANIGRNDPCPCGSGKKYKHCHGQLA